MRSKPTPVLFAAAALLSAFLPSPAEAAVSGSYRANGKDAKLAYAVAVKHDDFGGQKAVTVVLTEQDPKGEKDPSIGASFGHFGSALVVSILADGSVFGCEIGHKDLKHMGASSIGRLETENFKWTNGKVSGKLTTHGKTELFDETWEADLDFDVKAP